MKKLLTLSLMLGFSTQAFCTEVATISQMPTQKTTKENIKQVALTVGQVVAANPVLTAYPLFALTCCLIAASLLPLTADGIFVFDSVVNTKGWQKLNPINILRPSPGADSLKARPFSKATPFSAEKGWNSYNSCNGDGFKHIERKSCITDSDGKQYNFQDKFGIYPLDIVLNICSFCFRSLSLFPLITMFITETHTCKGKLESIENWKAISKYIVQGYGKYFGVQLAYLLLVLTITAIIVSFAAAAGITIDAILAYTIYKNKPEFKNKNLVVALINVFHLAINKVAPKIKELIALGGFFIL